MLHIKLSTRIERTDAPWEHQDRLLTSLLQVVNHQALIRKD